MRHSDWFNGKRIEYLEGELARAREDAEIWGARCLQAREERDTLLAALNRAGNRLAQVQPAVTEPWAYDIVPKAEAEIAAAIAKVEGSEVPA